MRFLILIVIAVGCSRKCDVYCGIKNECSVYFTDKFESLGSKLDNMPTEEANNFCLEYKGLKK